MDNPWLFMVNDGLWWQTHSCGNFSVMADEITAAKNTSRPQQQQLGNNCNDVDMMFTWCLRCLFFIHGLIEMMEGRSWSFSLQKLHYFLGIDRDTWGYPLAMTNSLLWKMINGQVETMWDCAIKKMWFAIARFLWPWMKMMTYPYAPSSYVGQGIFTCKTGWISG